MGQAPGKDARRIINRIHTTIDDNGRLPVEAGRLVQGRRGPEKGARGRVQGAHVTKDLDKQNVIGHEGRRTGVWKHTASHTTQTQTDRQTDRQTHRQTDRQTDRHTDRHTDT